MNDSPVFSAEPRAPAASDPLLAEVRALRAEVAHRQPSVFWDVFFGALFAVFFALCAWTVLCYLLFTNWVNHVANPPRPY